MPVHTLPIRGPLHLVVRVGAGSVTVHARDGLAEATVELEALGRDTRVVEQTVVEQRGSVLVVHGPRQGGVFDLPVFGGRTEEQALAVTVTVPSGTPTKISTYTAGITADGRLGACDIAFGAADVSLDHVDGDLRLRYGSGAARVVRVSGGVRARTGSGSVELGAVHGDVNLVSGSGPMGIGLPGGVAARLDVATGSGSVHSELPIEDAPAPGARAITVRARTGTGDVRLFRAVA